MTPVAEDHSRIDQPIYQHSHNYPQPKQELPKAIPQKKPAMLHQNRRPTPEPETDEVDNTSLADDSERKTEEDITEMEDEVRGMTVGVMKARAKVGKLRLKLSQAYSPEFLVKMAEHEDSLGMAQLFENKENTSLMTEAEVLDKLEDFVLQ